MYKAVFIDIDGTLIKSDHSVSSATISAIQALKQKSLMMALVSARPLHGISRICNTVGLQDYPVASLNGSYISVDGAIVFDAQIEPTLVEALHDMLQPFGATIIYYEKMKWFAEIEDAHVKHEQKITDVPVIIQPFAETLAQWKQTNSGPNKILVIAAAEKIAEMEKNVKPQFETSLNMYPSKPIYLEIMNKEASKTNAIKALMKRYDIAQAEVIAIGDNFNDKEMIEFAGIGIAMGNAPDEVKAVADYVTDTNNNDGVRKALEKYFGQ